MNILFLSKDYPPHLIGGVGVYISEISKLLARMGHNVYVITKGEDVSLEYTDNGVHIYRVKPKRLKIWDNLRTKIGGILERLEYSLAVSEKIAELLKYFSIDIVETCEARAEGFWYYLFRKNPPLIIKLHTPETVAFKLDHTPQTLDYYLIKLLEEFWLNKAAQKIGLSEEVVKLTARHFSMKIKNIPLVPNPIDIELFKPSYVGNDKDKLIILYVGRLEFRKGVHTLIRAFCYVQEQLPEAKLTFIGADCGMKSYLLNKTCQLEHPENVTFMEHIPRNNLIEYYQKSTICVVPSIWENYPYVCLEAMACGKPVIASDIGGLKTIITNRVNGFLVPPGSSKSLSEAIVLLLEDKRLRQTLGSNARKSIEQNYAPEKIAQKTLNIYQDILKKK